MTATPCFVGAPLHHPRPRAASSARGSDFICGRRTLAPQSSPKRKSRLTMGLFGLGFPELAVIVGVGIFIFGPSKIAEMGKDLGGLAGGVKKATSEFREAMQESLDEADREIESKRLEKESASQSTIDASAKAVEKTTDKIEG